MLNNNNYCVLTNTGTDTEVRGAD